MSIDLFVKKYDVLIDVNLIKISWTIWHLIRLFRIHDFFQFWYGMCSFSKMLFTKNDMFAFCWPDLLFFFVFFRTNKCTHWHFAKICPIFSPWTPIWDHFVHIWMMSVPKQPPLKLKSVKNRCLENRGHARNFSKSAFVWFPFGVGPSQRARIMPKRCRVVENHGLA